MKNKKGFTLTELLVVIVILLALTSGTVFGIERIQHGSLEKQLEEIITEIEEATDVYLNTNPLYLQELLNNPNKERCTRVYILQNEGLVKTELINPLNNKRIPANLCVYSKVVNGVITHEFKFDTNN